MRIRNRLHLVGFLFLAAQIIHGQQSGVTQEVKDVQVSSPETRTIESHHYEPYAYLPTITVLSSLPENQSKNPIVTVHAETEHHRVGGASVDPSAWLQELVANSTAIVVGRPYNRVSALTAEQTFVFSDYEFQIEKVLKDSGKHISTSSQIVVTRPGGAIDYGPKSFRAIDPEFQLFHLGERYLLFLTRLPDSGTYKVTAARAFHLEGGLVRPAKTHPLHVLQSDREDELLERARNYIAKEGGSK